MRSRGRAATSSIRSPPATTRACCARPRDGELHRLLRRDGRRRRDAPAQHHRRPAGAAARAMRGFMLDELVRALPRASRPRRLWLEVRESNATARAVYRASASRRWAGATATTRRRTAARGRDRDEPRRRRTTARPMRWTERQRAMLREMGVRLWLPEERKTRPRPRRSKRTPRRRSRCADRHRCAQKRARWLRRCRHAPLPMRRASRRAPRGSRPPTGWSSASRSRRSRAGAAARQHAARDRRRPRRARPRAPRRAVPARPVLARRRRCRRHARSRGERAAAQRARRRRAALRARLRPRRRGRAARRRRAARPACADAFTCTPAFRSSSRSRSRSCSAILPRRRRRGPTAWPAPRGAGSAQRLTGRFQPRSVACRARATVSSPAGASLAIVEPPPIVAPAPIVDRRDQHAVAADVHVVADRRAVLVRAVVVGGDAAGAVVDALADAWRRRGRRGGWPSRPSPSVEFLTSTKLPMCTSAPSSRAGAQARERADQRARADASRRPPRRRCG